jgi:hypothetical protein
LPATLAVDAVLPQDEGIVVAVPHIDVFPNGFRINLLMLLDPHRAQDLRALHRGLTIMPRVGVRFADGRVGGRSAMLGIFDLSKDAEGIPTQTYVASPEEDEAVARGRSVSGCIHYRPTVR